MTSTPDQGAKTMIRMRLYLAFLRVCALFGLLALAATLGCTPAQQRRWEGAAWASLGCATEAAAAVLGGVGELVTAAERGTGAKAIGIALAARHGVQLARCIVERAVYELAGGDGVVPAGIAHPGAAAAALWLREHPGEWTKPQQAPIDVRGVPTDAPR
jgi:hypothetical protein